MYVAHLNTTDIVQSAAQQVKLSKQYKSFKNNEKSHNDGNSCIQLYKLQELKTIRSYWSRRPKWATWDTDIVKDLINNQEQAHASQALICEQQYLIN